MRNLQILFGLLVAVIAIWLMIWLRSLDQFGFSGIMMLLCTAGFGAGLVTFYRWLDQLEPGRVQMVMTIVLLILVVPIWSVWSKTGDSTDEPVDRTGAEEDGQELTSEDEDAAGDQKTDPSDDDTNVVTTRPTITVGDMTLFVPPGPDLDNGIADLSDAIERGCALLAETDLPERPGKCMSLKGNPQRCQDVMIAVARGDQLKAVIVQEYSEEYVVTEKKKKKARWRQTWVSSDPDFQIELCGKLNWINSIWKVTEIASGDRWTVVASKYNQKRKGKRVPEINSPYNAGLDTPEMREAGLRYLAELAQNAQDYLQVNQVPSVYFEGLVSEIYPPSVPVALVLTENTGAVVFDECETDDCRLRELNNALIRLGANREEAFRHRNSSASAKGILQVTRSTYLGTPGKPKTGLRRLYPAANLPRDFQQVVNHDIGMRAAYVHLDSEMYPVPADRRQFYLEYPEPFYQYLAAAYNGSADRISQVITDHGAEWRDSDHLCTPRDCESRTYVEKFRFVWETIFGQGVDPDSLDINAYFAR